jgi:hypothetical protein
VGFQFFVNRDGSKKLARNKNLRKIVSAALACAIVLLLTACSDSPYAWTGTQNAISGMIVPFNPVASLTGSAVRRRSSASVAAVCPAAIASLYSLSASGERVQPPVQSVPVNADGSYSFANIRKNGIVVRKVNQLSDAYLVEVTGCNAAYARLLTGTSKQDIDWGTTLVTYITGTPMASGAKTAAPQNLESIYRSLASTGDFPSAYAALSSTPAITNQFQQSFNAAPALLEDASPMLVDVRAPSSMREGETEAFTLLAVQWKSSYTRAYRWEMDGVVFSHASSVNYAAGANTQGNHTVTVSWGQDDGFGDVDTTKPYRQRSFPLHISDDLVATPPTFAAVPALVNTTNINLRLNTGAALADCASFTGLAITEDFPIAPADPAQYTLTCTTGPTQNVPFTISSALGVHTIYLWAIDSAGNISAVPRTTLVEYNNAVPNVDITSPTLAAPPFQSAATFSGTCDASAGDVTFSGDFTGSPLTTACSTGTFSESLNLSAGDGSKTITATQTNSFGTSGSDSITVNRDATAPTVTLSSLAPDPTNSNAVVVSVTFSEGVTGFDNTKTLLTNATISSFTGSGTSYSITLVPTAQGPFSIALPAGAGTDAAGNASLASATLSRNYDSVLPTAVLATSAANPTNLTSIPFTITFSEAVSGLSASGISVTNGSVSGLTGSGTTYSFQVAPTAQGLVTVQVSAAAASDAAANASSASNTVSRTFDNVRPGVTLATAAPEPTNVSPIPVTVTFTEAVTGFSLSDLTLLNATAANLVGTGTSYTFDLVPAGQGAVSATVNVNAAQDAATNLSTASNTLSRTFDSTAPTTVLATSAAAYSKAAPFPMTITFSKSVTGLVLADLTITNGTASGLTGSGASYTFSVTPTAEGAVTAQVVAGAAQDSASNPTDVSNLVSIVYDVTSPTLAISVPTTGAFVNAANQAAFAVSGTCSENGQNVNLAVGAVTKAVACASGAFSTTMDLSSLADGPLTLTANLSDLATNAAPTQSVSLTKDVAAPTATLSGVPASPSNATSVNITVAGAGVTAYRYKIGTSGSTDCTNASGYSAETAVASAIATSISGIADGSVTVCVVGRDVAGNYQSFSTPTSATWMKDTGITPFSGLAIAPVSPGNDSTPTVSGNTEGNASLALYNAASCGGSSIATATAAAGGAFSLTPASSLGAGGSYTLSVRATDAAGNTVCSASIPYVLDTTAPTVMVTSTAPSPTNVSPIPFTVTFSEAVTGFSASGLTLVNGTASAITGSGTTYNFSVTPSAQGTVSVTVNAAAAKDAAQNNNTASATVSRIYDSVAPALTIASPSVGVGTNQNHMVFSGACEGSISIVISGSGASSPANATCSGSAYSVDIVFTAGEGIKNITLTQTDLAGNATAVSRAVPYDATPPGLTFTSAAVKDQLTNTSTVTFGGSCESGTNVVVAGGVDTASVACTGSVWTYTTATQSTDGNRTYTFTQTDPGTNSASITGTWQRDTVPPALTRSSPADATRAKDSVVITGACQTGLDVFFGGTGILSPLQVACSAGTYSQTVFFSSGDGTKAISIQQTDTAGNVATVNASFVRDNAPPSLTQTTVASPHWTNTNSATFGGACETGLTISVSRDGTAEGTAPCAGGAWTYTVAAQTTDATRTYSFTQTDTATNATTISAQWVRRTTNPAFSFTSASTFNTSSNTVTFYGNCMNGVAIQVTGADTSSAPCSGGTWTYTTAAQTVDATRTYNFRQTDPAGNTTPLSGTWTRNTNLPQLTLTSTTPFYSNGSATTFTGGCSNGITITVSGAVSTTLSCSSGTWSYPASQGTDGAYTYTFNQTDTYGNSTTVNAVWVRDTVAPAISAVSLNSGAAITNTSYVKAALTGTDSRTNITKFCLKTTAPAPAAGDSCWTAVNSNPPGLTPGLSLNLANYNYYLGITPGTYTVYAWLQDAAGNISANAGVAGVDRATIDYQIVYPPTLDTVFGTNTNSPGYPVPSPQLSVSAGGYVYIKWRASSTGTLGATPIKLSFTTNDTSWSTIGNVANAAGTGCTLNTSSADAATTGCYRWSAPTSAFMRLKIEVIDNGGRTTAVTLPPLNTGSFKLIAGNTEPGINASTLSSIYQFRQQTQTAWTQPNTFAISSSGVAYINDHANGILMIDPADGLTKILIPKTGVTSGNGALNTATVRNVYGIALDYQDRLLVWDNDQIRRVDFVANTITRIIGGGTSTAVNITNALDLKFEGYIPLPVDTDGEFAWRSIRGAMVPLPNGDLYFGSWLSPWVEAQYKFRRYSEASATQITTMLPNGYGHSGGTAVDISKCFMGSMGVSFDPATTTIDTVSIAVADHGDSSTTYCRGDGTRGGVRTHSRYEVVLDGSWTTKAVQPPTSEVSGAWAFYQRITGRNGKLYAIRRQTGWIFEYNPATTSWTKIAGTGIIGQCADGTAALSCDLDLQDMFVGAQGQIFLLDHGRIRTLDSSNRLVTLFGQALSSGDGSDPVLARFAQLWSIAVGTDGRVALYDENMIREVSADRSVITRLAGNGRYDWARVGNTANTSPLRTGTDWLRTIMLIDPANNDILFPIMDSTGRGVVGRLQRSTGTWQKLFGAGTNKVTAADGLAGDQITLGLYEDNVNAWADGFQPLALGTNGKMLVGSSGYPNYGTWQNTYLKAYDGNDSWRQYNIAGRMGPMDSHTAFCPDGTSAESCSAGIFSTYAKGAYDAVDNKWILLHSRGTTNSNRIGYIKDNMGDSVPRTMQTLVTLPRNAYNFAYWRTGGHEYIYYCGTNGLLYRNDVTAGTETLLSLPSTELKCMQNATLELDRNTSTLYFGFEKKGLHAIGSIDAI